MINDKKILTICLVLGLSGIIIFYLVPFIIGFFNTFIISFDLSNGLGFDNYISLFNNDVFQLALVNTFMFTIFVIFSVNIISLIIACFFKNHFKNSFLLNILILPLIIPTIVIALIFGDILIYDFLGEYAFVSIILIYLWKYTGFHTLVYITALNTVPQEQYEIAALDGATKWNKLRFVTLPCIFPFICFNIMLSITNFFRMFRDVYILFGDYPPKNIYLLQHFIQNNFVKLNMDYVFSAAYIFFGILFIVFTPLIIKGNRLEKFYD